MRPAMVLCIDDEAVGLRVRKIVLEQAGFQVLTALDGETGIQLFISNDIDIVLLDYLMPGMDGGEVAVELRRTKPWVPILMHTACVDLPQKTVNMVNSTLPKARGPKILIDKLQQLISASQLQEER